MFLHLCTLLKTVGMIIGLAGITWPASAQSVTVNRHGGLPGKVLQPESHNVLVILIDDVGIDAIGTYGLHPTAPVTPTFDALASEGLLFRNAFGQPVCSPTRSTMMTGHFPSQTGVGVQIPFRKPDHSHGTWSPILKMLPDHLPARYAKYAVGKWHLDSEDNASPVSRGFDSYRGYVHNLQDHYEYESTIADARGEQIVTVRRWSTSQEIDDALELIQSTPEDKPWFLWLGLHAAHSPWQAPPDHLHKYGDLTGASDRVLFRAMIQSVDTEIARLLNGIGPEVLARTTVIVAGDNGTAIQMQEAPVVSRGGKKQLYDGGTRVPLVIRSPYVTAPGREVNALVGLIDLHQTVLDLTFSKRAPATDSISLVPYFRDSSARAQRDWVHARLHLPNGIDGEVEYQSETAMVRTLEYKLLRFGKSARAVEFYNVLNDPLEEVNLTPGGNLGGLTPVELKTFEWLSLVLGNLGGP